MAEGLNELGAYVAGKLPGTEHSVAFGELTLYVPASDIVKTLKFLRDDPECRFVCFIDICGADYPDRELRFDVVYHLLSPYKNRRIRVKIRAGEDTLRFGSGLSLPLGGKPERDRRLWLLVDDGVPGRAHHRLHL